MKRTFRSPSRLLALIAIAVGALIVGVPAASADQTFSVTCGTASDTMGTVTAGETLTFTSDGSCGVFEPMPTSASSVTVTWNGGTATQPTRSTAIQTPAQT